MGGWRVGGSLFIREGGTERGEHQSIERPSDTLQGHCCPK